MQPATLPPSSKPVLRNLDDGRPMTHKHIVNKSRLPRRTVHMDLKNTKTRS
ncbi:MAG: MarR family transcriptional regulator, partial [Methanoregula sp.]